MVLRDLHLEEITRRVNATEVNLRRLREEYERYVNVNDGISGDKLREIGASLPENNSPVNSFEGLRLLRDGRKDYWSLIYEINPDALGVKLGDRVAVLFPQNLEGAIRAYSNSRGLNPAIKSLINMLAIKFVEFRRAK